MRLAFVLCLPSVEVHAVYPSISQEALVRMTPDEIITRDPSMLFNLIW